MDQTEFLAVLRTVGVGKRLPTDPFFKDDGNLAPLYKRTGIYDDDVEELCHELVQITCDIPGCLEKFETLLEFDSHYNAVHRFICTVCKKHLPTAHFLDLHLQETHDSFFAMLSMRKPSYACFVEECPLKFENTEERKAHCVNEHRFPHEFRYDQTAKKHNRKKKESTSSHSKGDFSKADASMDTACDGDPEMDKLEANNGSFSDGKVVQPPKLKNFTFGHSKNRGFSKQPVKYEGRKFTIEKKSSTNTGNLNSDNVMMDIKDNLPEV